MYARILQAAYGNPQFGKYTSSRSIGSLFYCYNCSPGQDLASTPALPCAKIDDALIEDKPAGGAEEALRPEGCVVGEQGLGVVHAARVVVNLRAGI